MDFTVRQASADDCSELAAFLQRLVSLRNEPGLRTQNAKDLFRDGFTRSKPKFSAFLAETSGPDKEVIGFALYSYRYHSFIGRGLHLNNLFVLEPHRGKGVATQLLKRLIRAGLRQGCHNMGFMSNSWNHIAKNLYKKMGAINLTETYGLHAYEYVTGQKDMSATCSHQSYPRDGVVIRKARPDDLTEITRLLKAYKETQNVCMLEDIDENILKTNGFEKSPQFFAYVAEKESPESASEKRLVGILTYSYAYCSHSSTTVSLDAVYVDESYRREGIGCALFHTFRQDEALKNHIKLRIFVDSSIDTSRDFFRHVNAVDQSERAQWIWSIVPREDLSNYALSDQINECDLENGLTSNLKDGDISPNGDSASDNLSCLKDGVTLNGVTNVMTSLKLAANSSKPLKCVSNDETSLNLVANGDVLSNGTASEETAVNYAINRDATLKCVTNGGGIPSKSEVDPLNLVINGHGCEELIVNGETTNH